MRLFEGVYYRAARVIEVLSGLSSEAKRLWAYARFREYPDRPGRWSEREACDDLALPPRTIQRAKRELVAHEPPLLVVHQRGTRNAEAAYHALLTGEKPPPCCQGQGARPADSGMLQPDKSRSSAHNAGGLTGAKLAGSSGTTPRSSWTCAPHRTGEGRKGTEKETGGRPPRREGGGQALPEDPTAKALAQAVGLQHFEVWFSNAEIENTDGLTIRVPSPEQAAHIRHTFMPAMRSVAKDGPVRIEVASGKGNDG